MIRGTAVIGASTALSLVACGGAAQVAEVAPTALPATSTTVEATTTTAEEETTTTAPVTTAPARRPLITVTTWPVDNEADDDAYRSRILACIRSHEENRDPTAGPVGYATNTGNGHFGAYQFDQGTWDGAAARAGYPEWSGSRASDAPAAVQDDAAWQLYLERGFQPWPPATRWCRA